MLTVEILQFPVLRSFLSSEYLATELPQFYSAGLGPTLYSLKADPTGKTVFNSHSIVVNTCFLIPWPEMGCVTVVLLLHACSGHYLATSDIYRVTKI
jgi:hypothetical protein